MIQIRDLTRSFEGKQVVNGVSFDIGPGQITGYLGPNGAGKSTTVKMITGVLPPTSGSISVCGYDVADHPLEVKQRIGYVPESQALYTSLTPHEYLSLVSDLHDLEPGAAAESIHQLAEAFGIENELDRLIETFSKGMRQKVLIIGALLHDPEVILFDEPLSGLDVNAALTLRKIVVGLAERGKTVLYCSHILDVVERLCSRIILLDEGRVIADAATDDLLSGHPDHRLESVFQDLTRRQGADEWVDKFLEAVDTGSAAQPG